MKITIITSGKPRLEYAELGIDLYAKRLGHFHDVDLYHARDIERAHEKIEVIGKSGGGMRVVLFDEGAREINSSELAQKLTAYELSFAHLVFVIGGPDGHMQEMRDIADESLSLSRLTFPHDLALLVALEALYRAVTISQGHPYHRE